MSNLLQQIQELQFTDRRAAEARLLPFIQETFGLDVKAIELRPSAVSLNSFNGFITLADGRRLFFKTHTETDNVIGEYYQAATLADAGYSVIQPVYSSTEAGQHLLIYEVIEDPSVFDVAWEIENGDRTHFQTLTQAQQAADDELYALYLQTLHQQSAEASASAPIHQLFHHRILQGRLERFYGPLPHHTADTPADAKIIHLPNGERTMQDVRRVNWQINGQVYRETIDQIIHKAIILLNPKQPGPAITGHGDAHNGNVFLELSKTLPSMLYFDPAFAGEHDPLLDLAKPLFHNVFAMWMYYPEQKQSELSIRLDEQDGTWVVKHDYTLPDVREMFLSSKVDRVLIPILEHLKAKGELREDWRAYLKAALFCCPFLTMNLANADRFPPDIALLGLAMSVEMGAESDQQRSRIDQALDEVQQALI